MVTVITTYKIPEFAALINKTVRQVNGMIRKGLPVTRINYHREISIEVYNEWIKSQTAPLVQTYEKAPALNTGVGSKVRRIKA